MSDNKNYRIYPLGNLFAIGDTDGDEVMLHWDAMPHLVADLLQMMDDADWPLMMDYLQNKAPALAERLRQGIGQQGGTIP